MFRRRQKGHQTMKNLCVECQLSQREKDKHLCGECAHKRLIDSFKDIKAESPHATWF